MGTPGKPDDTGRSNPSFAAKFAPFRNMSIQQKLKDLLTKAATRHNLGVGTKLADEAGVSQSQSQPDNKSVPGSPAKLDAGEGNTRILSSDARGSSRSRSPVSTVKKGGFETGDELSNGSDEEVEKLTGPINRRISAGSVSSDYLSLPSRNSDREVDEGGYIVCLVVITSLLSGDISDSKAVLFKAMQAELTLGLKTYFPLPTAGHAAREVFNKMKRLADALSPVLGMEIKESACVKAMELLDASEADDCYDHKYLKTLREGGFMQYFCDIVTICRNFNSQ